MYVEALCIKSSHLRPSDRDQSESVIAQNWCKMKNL